MPTKARGETAADKLLVGNTRPTAFIGTTIAVPPSALEAGHSRSQRHTAKDKQQRAERKALARRWSDASGDGAGVDLLSASHLGLLVNYACIGFLNGLLPALVYPLFKLYLNMDGFQVSSAAAVVQLPWSYKTFFGLLSDHVPLGGYRRKPYILLGWGISLAALTLLAHSPMEPPYYKPGEIQRTRDVELRIVENANASAAGARYLLQLSVVCAGFVLADVACDGVMVELAQGEPLAVRGQAQTTIYMVRYSASLVAGVTAALCFNGQDYGGSFSWSVAPTNVFWACVTVAMLGGCGTVLCLDETRYWTTEAPQAPPMCEMWRVLQQRAVWQLVGFHFSHSFLTSFSFSNLAALQEFWVGVTPLSNSLAACVSTALLVAATVLMRQCFLHSSWRTLMLLCSLTATTIFAGVNLAVTFDVTRSQWFYLGGPQLAAIPEGMRHVVAGLVTVEIAEKGFESATYALLTTAHNLADPFAQSVTNLVDACFDVSDAAIASDTPQVRQQVADCLYLALGVQLLGLATLTLLPRQKQEAQMLKRHGGSSRLAAGLTLLGVLAALAWATTTNLLAVHSSTACLRVAGGRGC